MRKLLLTAIGAAAFAAASPAMAGVTFNTSMSTLSCNSVANCNQVDDQTVSFDGLTLQYIAGSGINIQPTSFINLGELDSTGTGTFDLTGLLLSITIDQTVPGGTGTLPGGDITGILTGNSSGATITWLSGGVTINGYQYTVTNNPLAIVSPSSCTGAGCGVTSIQGQVAAVPEPAAWALMLLGFAGVGFAMRRQRKPVLAQVA